MVDKEEKRKARELNEAAIDLHVKTSKLFKEAIKPEQNSELSNNQVISILY